MKIRKAILMLPMVLFLNCWQVLFVSDLNELHNLGVDTLEVRLVEEVKLPGGEKCYRVYYNEKGNR